MSNRQKLVEMQRLKVMLQNQNKGGSKPRKVLSYEDQKRMQEKMDELKMQAETG